MKKKTTIAVGVVLAAAGAYMLGQGNNFGWIVVLLGAGVALAQILFAKSEADGATKLGISRT